MISTLLLTIIVEGVVVVIYCVFQKRPAGALFQASFIINMFTQSMLWLTLRMFFRYYQPVLLIVEVLIWLTESVFLYRLSGNNVNLSHAVFLSLCMNAASFGVGWYLPV